MTTRPRLVTEPRQVVGLLALALFGVLAAVFLSAPFGEPVGFSGEGSITATIGYALLNIADGGYQSEGFLVALIIIALVLDAAIDGAVMLARREEGPSPEGARELLGDGGNGGTDRRHTGDTGQQTDAGDGAGVDAGDGVGIDSGDGAGTDAGGGAGTEAGDGARTDAGEGPGRDPGYVPREGED